MNKISRDLTTNSNNYAIKPHNVQEEQHAEIQACNSSLSGADVEEALVYMGNINKAQLNSISKRTTDAIKAFEADPELAENIMEMEDELIEKGYSQEEAFKKANIFYAALKDARTYSN